MRFCPECDNMLEPREFKHGDRSSLQFDCKLCNSYCRAQDNDEMDNCVYRTDYTTRAENLHVDPECIKDPTLSRRRDVVCKWCSHNEAVTFTQPTKDRLNLIFVCCKCARHWTKGEGEKDEEEVFSDDDDNN